VRVGTSIAEEQAVVFHPIQFRPVFVYKPDITTVRFVYVRSERSGKARVSMAEIQDNDPKGGKVLFCRAFNQEHMRAV
jgi:hypothetical protein